MKVEPQCSSRPGRDGHPGRGPQQQAVALLVAEPHISPVLLKPEEQPAERCPGGCK